MAAEIPDKLFFKIGEVAKITGVKPHVLRYWESEFKLLKPSKSATGQRVYQKKDVEKVFAIKELLYDEKFTIAGAKRRMMKSGREEKPQSQARQLSMAFDQQEVMSLLKELKKELQEIAEILKKS